MTKYNRITGKVFGGNANATGDNPEIGQFGSAKDGSYFGTSDISSIQALPAWGKGWVGAVTPETNFPPLPEMTGAMKVFSEQQCYLLQQGIPEWDNATIYYKNGFSSKNGKIYISQSDENQGNDPEADIVNWKEFSQDKANKDLDNLTEAGEKHFLNKSQITNCLLEVPQRIKLELNNGTLTLKAGSQVIVPNGFEADGTTPKFDYVTVESDLNLANGTGTEEVFFIVTASGNNLSRYTKSVVFSGSVAPTVSTQYACWYDTANNVLKQTINTGATWEQVNWGLPIGVGTTTTTSVTSIDQVFNGFGYIGSTVWVDKGVKGLIPNGRNADGTLNNIEFTTSRVLTQTNTDTLQNSSIILTTQEVFGLDVTYSNEVNYNIFNITQEKIIGAIVGKFDRTNGVISNFQPKTTFHAVDWNDKSTVSGWGMPSNRYINLTLGASGTTYTAPANGWFSCNFSLRQANASGIIWAKMLSQSIGDMKFFTNDTDFEYIAALPVRKGDIIVIQYQASSVYVASWETGLRFMYAEGVKE